MELDCGIPRARILTWLDDELALVCDAGTWAFAHKAGTCRIRLSALENRVLGKLDLQRTLVCIEGDEEATEEFYRLFTLRFISAGG